MYKKQFIGESYSLSQENIKINIFKNKIIDITNKNLKNVEPMIKIENIINTEKPKQIKKFISNNINVNANGNINVNKNTQPLLKLDNIPIEKIDYSKYLNNNTNYDKLIDMKKINVIVSWCFIPNWVIMYTFYLLEQKTFDKFPENINIIPITKFTNNITFEQLDRVKYINILEKCYQELFNVINNVTANIILYFINSQAYETFFKKYPNIPSNIKIIIWRDDLFTFNNIKFTNINNYKQQFDSKILDRCDVLLSPSIKYFENIQSKYLNKTKFYSYSLNEELYDKFNVKYEDKIDKILLSGETGHFVYKRRKQLSDNLNINLFEKIHRPKNKIDHSCVNTYAPMSNSHTGYYNTLSKYKACMMTIAEYPVDFLLGKFIEIFNANTIPIFDYTYELDKRLFLEPYDHYIPILNTHTNNFILQDSDYYRSFIDDKKIFNSIIENGKIVRKHFSLTNNREFLYKIFAEQFIIEKSLDTQIIQLDLTFEEFNIFLGQIEVFAENRTTKLKIINKKPTQTKILNLFYSKNMEIILGNNIHDALDVKKIIKINNTTDKYIINNYINEIPCIKNMFTNNNKLNKKVITVIFTNTNQYELVNQIVKLINNNDDNINCIVLSISQSKPENKSISHDLSDDIMYINNSMLNIIFTEKYSGFLKNCGAKNILLLQSNNKKLVNRIYNPFATHEITVTLNNNKFALYEMNKIVFIIYNIFNTNKNHTFSKIYANAKNALHDFINQEDLCKKYYYHGEFGYFHTIILGTLEKYFLKNKDKIVIQTYEDHAEILKLKFSNVHIEKIPLEKERDCHGSTALEKPIGYFDLAKSGEIKFQENLNFGGKLNYMSTPIKYVSENLQKKHFININNEKKYIAIFPRNRHGLFGKRNMSIDLFNAIENSLLNFFKRTNKNNYEIIIVGKKEEVNSAVLQKNYKFYDTIHEAIYLMNNKVELLIAPDSGYIDFAKNCGVKNIIMLYEGTHIKYHEVFNPFNTNFMTVDYAREFNRFDKLLEYL